MVLPKLMKYPIFKPHFQTAIPWEKFEGSVNLAFEIYWRGPVKYCSCI